MRGPSFVVVFLSIIKNLVGLISLYLVILNRQRFSLKFIIILPKKRVITRIVSGFKSQKIVEREEG